MKGVEIATDVNGKNLDWPELWPFYARAEKLDAFVLVHPGVPPGAAQMGDYSLFNLIGYPFVTSLAAASLVFGGVLEDFPRLKFCFAHGGGFIPYQRGRLEHGYRVKPECRRKIPRPPSDYLNLLYFDTVTHYLPALEYLIRTAGVDNVLLGSDYPFDVRDSDPVNSQASIFPCKKRRYGAKTRRSRFLCIREGLSWDWVKTKPKGREVSGPCLENPRGNSRRNIRSRGGTIAAPGGKEAGWMKSRHPHRKQKQFRSQRYSVHRWHRHTSDKAKGYEVTYPENFEEIYHLIRGNGLIQWKTEEGKIKEQEVGAGDTILLPVDVVEHQLLNSGPEKMHVVFCGNPTPQVKITPP
jgi:mannose-6-phosphate isomerase-like protein (cupin superfamily)